MNGIDPSKYEHIINRNNKKENNVMKKYVNNLVIRCLLVVVILLTLSIVYKNDNDLKDKISSYFFEESISFTKINKLYEKYLGGILPLKKTDNSTVTEVFDEKLSYSSTSLYYDGIKMSVADSYLVPSLEEGMVVFVGEKENYGKTIIVENLDGIDYWYGNISNTSLKLYDYVEKGTLIGEVQSDLYMVFSRDGKYLNYEEYIY